MSAAREFTLHAVGDLMFYGPLAERMAASGDPLWGFRPLGERLRDCDLLFGNFETPISVARRNERDAPACYFAPPGMAAALKGYGFSVVNLAHNHIYDFGAEGVEATLRELEAAQVPHFGIGRTADEAARAVVVTLSSGVRVAFLGYTTSQNTLNPRHTYVACFPHRERVVRDVRAARSAADIVVVSCHTGAQFNFYPAPEARQLARCVLAAGATLYLGHHPHVPQGCERIGAGLAAYSLGDFLAPVHNEDTRRTFFLRVRITGDRVSDFAQVPCYITDECQTILATGPQAAEISARLNDLNCAIAEGRSDALHFGVARQRFFSQYVTSWRRELREQGPGFFLRKLCNLRAYHLQLIWRLILGQRRR